jgi:hypothetical protein
VVAPVSRDTCLSYLGSLVPAVHATIPIVESSAAALAAEFNSQSKHLIDEPISPAIRIITKHDISGIPLDAARSYGGWLQLTSLRLTGINAGPCDQRRLLTSVEVQMSDWRREKPQASLVAVSSAGTSGFGQQQT